MDNLEIVRTYEVATLALYLGAAAWIWRMQNPVYLGALIGATLVYGYDWVYCTKFFFNATYNPALIWIPDVNIYGVREPVVIPFAYGMAFGPFAVLLVMLRSNLDRAFGTWNYAVVWVLGAFGVMLYEVPVVHSLHIWTYHQTPGAMLWGVPWSDIWLAGNLILVSYAGLRWMERWAALPPGSGFHLRRETTWKGFVMGGVVPWAAFYVTFVIQLFWYSSAQPWAPAGRPF